MRFARTDGTRASVSGRSAEVGAVVDPSGIAGTGPAPTTLEPAGAADCVHVAAGGGNELRPQKWADTGHRFEDLGIAVFEEHGGDPFELLDHHQAMLVHLCSGNREPYNPNDSAISPTASA